MPQGSILGANKIQPRICHFCRAEQKYVLRSSGVRHRKWALLGVKLPDFTVGMSSHCVIRGYSLSLASIKCEGETAPSLPECQFWAAICSMMTFEFTAGYVHVHACKPSVY